MEFIKRLLFSIKTSITVLKGKQYPYLNFVERYFDIKPEMIVDKIFFQCAESLDDLYDGSGPLIERLSKEVENAKVQFFDC